MNLIEKEPWIQEFIGKTDDLIHDIFEKTGSADFKDLFKAQHHGGKRLRPIVIAASARLGESPSPALPYGSAAIELLHLASLFHDDVLDETTQRRDQLTARQHIGNLNSILAGDYLLAEVLDLALNHLPKPLANDLLSTIKKMTKSEILSKKLLNNLQVSDKEYLQIIENKTASVFALATSLGIRLTSQDSDLHKKLFDYGLAIGMAYQLIDDLEDMMGVIDQSDNDLGHGYISMPIISLLKAVPADVKPLIHYLVRERKANEFRELIGLMRSFSIFKVVLAEIQKHLDRARQYLADIRVQGHEQSISLDFLKSLCGFLAGKAIRTVDTYEQMPLSPPEKPAKIYAIA